MKAVLGVVVTVLAVGAAAELAVKREAVLPLAPGNLRDFLLLMDTDHDGMGEVIHNPNRYFQIAEYRPVNRYELVLSDTALYPMPGIPESIGPGYFTPSDVGDVDRDGLADILGQGFYRGAGGDSAVLCTFESRDSFSYPDSLVWWTTTPNPPQFRFPPRYADLDGDSALDIVTPWGNSTGHTAVFENVGDNRESLVGTASRAYRSSLPTIGDFDQNGRTDYTFASGNWDYVVECTGDNHYALVCSLYTEFWGAVQDRFAGRDVDHNGRPEYFEVYYNGHYQTLCQFEATAEHQYVCDTVDTASGTGAAIGQSLCADIDGDSLDEIVWGCGSRTIILKPTGPHQYEKVCDFRHNGLEGIVSMCNAADFNGNGYKEIFVGTDGQSFVLEVECIRVLYPDTTRYLRSGDTCEIRWQLFQPPRCDSVSLFLRTDTTIVNGFYRLDTIVTGLSPAESTYLWVVPDTTLDSARILAIAYGPGWQFDESDSPFRIAPSGAAGPRITPPRDWALSVNPNPARGAFTVSYDVPCQSRLSVGVYDAGGRLVKDLAEDEVVPGRYKATLPHASLPAGVYFVRLDSGASRISRKVVLTE
jgi:hypothetical protein